MRTPLESVLGFSDLLRLNAGGEPLSHRQRQAAERIGEAATRLLTLVEGMSALAEAERPATGRLQRVDPLLLAHRACAPCCRMQRRPRFRWPCRSRRPD
ncbi:histidine kinase dimerization/phospho-acceptor domain-containing protein [Brevundimonas naejangsanensis]